MNEQQLIQETARATLHIEAVTLQGLQASVDADFVASVKRIYDAKGRAVVTGIGKSAIIAQKIVATLNSTGTPALFMHAADAIHGDLGMVRPYDVVLCISKSGNTSEIKVLTPLVKHLGSCLIGMTSSRESYLGQQADFVLHTPVSQEADPNNLAPTASTTAQMAMGDALATALLALRGFTPQDFAQYHPGGALGKQLYLRVADLYPQNQRPQVLEDTPLPACILEMTAKCLGATAVLTPDGQLAGIITDGDLRRMLKQHPDLITSASPIDKLRARDLMHPTPRTVRASALAVTALQLMRQHSISQLIVVDDADQYLGFVHLHDLVREGLI